MILFVKFGVFLMLFLVVCVVQVDKVDCVIEGEKVNIKLVVDL